MNYIEAHTRYIEIGTELMQTASAVRIIELLDDAIICVITMSRMMAEANPHEADALRRRQVEGNPRVTGN